MRNLTFSEVSGGPCCKRDVNRGAETDPANLIFMWYPVTTWNNKKFSACFTMMLGISSSGFHCSVSDKF